MLKLYRTNKYIIAQDEKGKTHFNLQSKSDCDRVQELTKAGFDLAISNPYKVIDCNTMTVEGEED